MIIAYGKARTASESNVNIIYPITFTTLAYILGGEDSGTEDIRSYCGLTFNNITLSSCKCFNWHGAGDRWYCNYIIIGY